MTFKLGLNQHDFIGLQDQEALQSIRNNTHSGAGLEIANSLQNANQLV